jgi:cytochrome c5
MRRLFVIVVALFVSAVLAVTAQPKADGQQIFRFDTFGDEQLWTDTLQLHTVVSSLPPKTALSVGLKVDADALPASVVNALKAGAVNLDDPAVTRQLLSANAVVGVIGKVNASGTALDSLGVTCALCHSTVDDSLAPGIGTRLDGWANRTLNVGAIVALSPVLTSAQKAIFTSWGPGRYDPRLHAFNGTTFIELNRSSVPVVIPPAYGLRLVGFETFTGDGPISYWNSYVAVTQMGGQGSFSDPRIKLTVTQTPDLVTPKLPALREYQESLRAPAPPRGSFDVAMAQRGRHLFNGQARCDTCHTPPAFTDVRRSPGRNVPLLHAPAETGMDPVYASRTATGRYRSSPLAGIWQHPPYFHDGSAGTLLAVVNHYDKVLSLGLSIAQKADLVEYLKSL